MGTGHSVIEKELTNVYKISTMVLRVDASGISGEEDEILQVDGKMQSKMEVYIIM